MRGKRIGLLLGLCCAVLLAACGGGNSADPPGIQGFMQQPVQRKTMLAAASGASVQRAASVLDHATLLAWAQQRFSAFFGGEWVDGTYGVYSYRFYPATGNYIGFDNDDIYVLGPVSDGELLYVGPVGAFACQVYPDCGSGSSQPPSTSPYVASGNVHDLLKFWRQTMGGSISGTVSYYVHNADGTMGPLHLRSSDTCFVLVDADGNISDGNVTFRYEDANGATNTIGATKARLYGFSTATGQVEPGKFFEIDHELGFMRKVDSGSPLETVCGWAASADSARFPSFGTLVNTTGTFVGRVADVPIQGGTSGTLPAAVKVNASCTADINGAGQVTVTVGGVQLPAFTTYDTAMDQSTVKTMFTGNALLDPGTTYALQFPASGFAGAFSVSTAPLTYSDLGGSPVWNYAWMISCSTSRI